MFRRLCTWGAAAALLAGFACFWGLIATPRPAHAAASKDIQELQRDIATLQELIKNLQKSQDQFQQSQNDKLTELRVLVQQAINSASSADKAVNVIQSSVQQSMRDQEGKIQAPVAQVNSRLSSMGDDLKSVQQAVSDLTALVNKIQTQLTDANNALKVLQAPPAAPPAPAGGTGAGGAAPPGDQPPMSATDLFIRADGDRRANNNELALQEFASYVKYYPDTPQAAAAQFYIGYIRFLQGDWENAAAQLDLVAEKYPEDTTRAPQALYYEGLSLLKLNRKTDAAQPFRDVVKKYPNSSNAQPACEQLTNLTYKCPTPASAPAKTPAKTAAPAKKK